MLLIKLGGSDYAGCHLFGHCLVAHATRVGVGVPRGTYSGSSLSSQPITSRADLATDFERPRAKLDLVSGPLEIVPIKNHY